jgi:hypothetical protein
MSAGEDSRDAAAGFGDAAEDVVGDIQKGIDVLQGEDNPPAEPNDGGDGDITININR